MLYGTYLSAQASEAHAFRQSVIANNMANAGTVAFKRDVAVFKDFLPHDLAHGARARYPESWDQQTGGVDLSETFTDFSNGPLKATGRSLDVAILGQGFLRVAHPDGERLTRNGQFSLDADRRLVTADGGFPVLDAEGVAVAVPEEALELSIASDGTISGLTPAGTSVELARLGLVEPSDYNALLKTGDGFFQSPGGDTPADPTTQIRQGFVEESGINPVASMVEMIETSRSFETNMNMIRLQDETLGRLLQSLPRQ